MKTQEITHAVPVKARTSTVNPIKVVVDIPESELWLYRSDNMARLNKSIEWAESNPRRDNFDEIMEKAKHAHPGHDSAYGKK